MQTINILENDLINKIAAGEVVENPKNVVKELVENSIDAKASSILIEVKNAGLQLIKVEDDGIGMSKEDAHLCFERHATSKIKSFEDLISINSMGFRGEALASIAAISKIELKTSQNNLAYHLFVNSGKIESFNETARTNGTTIEVKSLFFNVPVRKKFLKSISVINLEIIKTSYMLALANPDVKIKLVLDGNEIFSSLALKKEKLTSLKQTIQNVLGQNFLKSCFEVNFKHENFEIFGLIGYPLSSKKTKNDQYLIINNRAVYSNLISKFIKEAYATRISEKEYPIFALHLNLPAEQIDVNVHPQKKEIRFKDSILIKDLLKKAISKSFENILGGENFDDNLNFLKPEINFENPNFDREYKNSDIVENFSRENEFKKNQSIENFDKQIIFKDLFQPTHLLEKALIVDNYFVCDSKYLSSFIDIENCEKMSVIDLRGLFFHYLFKVFKDKNQKKDVLKQNLINPITIDLDLKDVEFIENNTILLKEFGFDVRRVSKSSISIDAANHFLNYDEIEDLFLLILDDLKSSQKSAIENVFEKKLAQSLSRFSKKTKKSFSNQEVAFLIDYFLENKFMFDPLGNRVLIMLSGKILEKIFKEKNEF
ncbi:MAG: DNA mismatch repair endonuclease MutL [Parachlamydiales bacterium]|nr:DNA mismatch repair endonuclease MutL [Parachlamydiales bacterium]